MIYTSETIDTEGALEAAKRMCVAARTAPKTRGIDNIVTRILTGEDKNALAGKMEEIDERLHGEARTHFTRDADNVRAAQAVVLIGVKRYFYGLNCTDCGFASCEACRNAGGFCVFAGEDLGIAVGSACASAADSRADSRVMYSAGKSVREMPYGSDAAVWLGIPVSVSGKSPFFDRKPRPAAR